MSMYKEIDNLNKVILDKDNMIRLQDKELLYLRDNDAN